MGKSLAPPFVQVTYDRHKKMMQAFFMLAIRKKKWQHFGTAALLPLRRNAMFDALKAGIASGEWKVAVAFFAALAVLMVI